MLNEPDDKKLHAIEPAYEGIPPGILSGAPVTYRPKKHLEKGRC